MASPISSDEKIRPIIAEIRTVQIPPRPGEAAGRPAAAPFITISREAGAGAWTLAGELVEALNQGASGERPWTCWDRELVEKVAADYQLSEELIESLEYSSHSWLMDFLSSLSLSDRAAADEARIYGRVAATIRAGAGGRVVIVGCGAVFVTRHMPGGLHVRLVAPLADRIAFMARQYGLSEKAAANRVRELERNRQLFYKRYWPGETLDADKFALTINTSVVDRPVIVELIRTLVRPAVSAASAASAK